jgi:hypothetical protein
MEYYTYAYLREDGTPYYIGKGKSGRIDNTFHNINLPPEERRIFLKKNLTDEQARNHEIYMIAVLGRKDLQTGILRNMTAGGEGCSGRIFSQETKNKISKKLKGIKKSEEHRKKLSEAAKKRKASKETREKMSKAMAGKMSKEKNPNYGKRWWNNGMENKFCRERPGENFSLGRLINKA